MQNYFQLLGVSESFGLDMAQLEQRYYTLQREFHPDRQSAKTAAERQKALLTSMDVNQAYQTLKDPVLRAGHLLALQGIRVNTDGHDTVKATPELLMEIMTMREEVADCKTVAQLEHLEKHGQREWSGAIETLAVLFNASDWQQAAMVTLRLRYLEKYREELRVIRSQRFREAS